MSFTKIDSNARRGLVLAMLVICGLALLPSGVVAAPATASSNGPDTAGPGDTVTISVTLTNTGNNPGGYIANVSVPDGWSVDDQVDDGAIWNDGDRAWLWQSIDSGDSVTPSITMAIPSDESAGSYEIATVVKSTEGIEANTTHTVTVDSQADTASDENDTSKTDNKIPGFGIGSAIMALSGVGYVLQRRV